MENGFNHILKVDLYCTHYMTGRRRDYSTFELLDNENKVGARHYNLWVKQPLVQLSKFTILQSSSLSIKTKQELFCIFDQAGIKAGD